MLGFCFGLVVFPTPTAYLFERFGLNMAMLMFTPVMLIHFAGVVTFSQKGSHIPLESRPEDKPLSQSILSMAKDTNVS